jgi:dTDP-4-amino-4,6-dideoxygalactose transaminase
VNVNAAGESGPARPVDLPAARVVFSEQDRRDVAALVDDALRTGALTLGPLGERLEREFAARHGALHAIAVSSGTAALEIVLRYVGVEGGEVVVPANTFYATAGAVVHAGATPRFADVDATTLALSVETVDAALTPATRAVILVHVGGLITPAVDDIRALCDARGVPLVEDAAHAHGASWRGRAAGTFGTAGAFSFYATKVMTSAEGGMITTADGALAADARFYRDQGKASFLEGGHVRVGSAWRMSELHAAVGLVHLRRLDEAIATRGAAAAVYDRGLAAIPGIEPLAIPAGCHTNYYKYVAFLDDGIERATVKQRLRAEHGVALSGEVYARPLHEEPVFAEFRRSSLPVAEDVAARQVCLPIYSDMTEEEAARVVDAVAAVFGTGPAR